MSVIGTNYASISNSDDAKYIEFVSMHKDKMYGYMFASITDTNPNIAQISNVINFEKADKFIFGRDLKAFLDLLKANGIKKVEWAVWEGNPAKRLYSRIKGVRYVGCYTRGVIHKGVEVDLHMYELFL